MMPFLTQIFWGKCPTRTTCCGSQILPYEKLLQRTKELGIKEESIWWYLQTRQFVSAAFSFRMVKSSSSLLYRISELDLRLSTSCSSLKSWVSTTRMLGVLVCGEAIPQTVDQHHQQFIRIPLGGHSWQFATPQALHDLQGCDMHDG